MEKKKKSQIENKEEDSLDEEDILEEEELEEALDDELEEESVKKDFSFSNSILATNKEVKQKRPKNLEDELEEEPTTSEDKRKRKESEEEDESEEEKGYGVRERDDDEEKDFKYNPSQRESSEFYGSKTDGGNFYDTNRGSEAYSNQNETKRAKNLYTTGEGLYQGGQNNTMGLDMGNTFYDPKENKKNPREKDWISTPTPGSGLEGIAKKTKKERMSYEFSDKKGGSSYN